MHCAILTQEHVISTNPNARITPGHVTETRFLSAWLKIGKPCRHAKPLRSATKKQARVKSSAKTRNTSLQTDARPMISLTAARTPMTAPKCRDGKPETALAKTASQKNVKPDIILPVSLTATTKREQSVKKIPMTPAAPSTLSAAQKKSARLETARTLADRVKLSAAVHASIQIRARISAAQMPRAAALSPARNSRNVLAENVSCHLARMKRNRSARAMTRTSASTFMAAISITAAPVVPSVRTKKQPKQVAALKANAPIVAMTTW